MAAGDKVHLLKTDDTETYELVQTHPAEKSSGGKGERPAICDESACHTPGAEATTSPPQPSETGTSLQAASAAGQPTAVMLVLTGVPGAGKSTFSHELCAASPRWQRVNQDTVNNGKRGTRQQCLSLARSIIARGGCAIIDRCNLSPDQRSDFLALAQLLGVQAHAVALDLPVKLCAKQAAGRAQHEGGVQGPGAAKITFQNAAQAQKLGPPLKSEGLQSVLVCTDHKDVARALSVWTEFFESSISAEEAFKAKGGGKRRIDNFFKPSGSAKMAAVERPEPSKLPSGGDQSSEFPAKLTSPKRPRSQEEEPIQEAKRLCLGGVGASPTVTNESQAASAPDKSTTAPTADPAGRKPFQHTGEGSEALAAPETCTPPTARDTPKKNAFAALMASAKRKPPPAASSSGRSAAGGQFADALMKVAINPERERQHHPGMVVADQYVVIHDKFPKARLHALMIPRDSKILGLADLRSSHVPLLQLMKEAAEEWVEAKRATDPGLAPVRLGFHSLPSLRPLHLHLISQDFDSTSLKTKKHWNSFTSDFFLPLSWAQQQLREGESLQIDEGSSREKLKADLKCHRCRGPFKTMPALKTHISSCTGGLDFGEEPLY